MEQHNHKPLLLICGSRFTTKALHDQLSEILPSEIPILDYSTNEECQSIPDQDVFAVFSSREVFHDFDEQNSPLPFSDFLIAERTILNQCVDTILSLPREEEILFVNDSRGSAEESIEYLRNIGFDFLKLIPYYPGCIAPSDIHIAVTPGEVDIVPPGIRQVYNIRSRTMEFTTIVKILQYYNILDQNIVAYAEQYLKGLLSFARRVSNAADEACKVMKTVRRELIGSGYYAKYSFRDIVGDSEEILHAKRLARKVAKTDLSVLIEGENGTGKELFASAIHNASSRVRGPFVAINFSALPDQLAESELFGYEEGAFTGAKKGGKVGLFQQATGGTLFLDEIGDISLKMQAKLLRVLQEKEIMKIGGDKIVPIDVRIIAATNKDLTKMIEEKTFRKDLYYRLREGLIYLPPLNRRKKDIPQLLDYWEEKGDLGKKAITEPVLEAFQKYTWPGNVRELLNTLKFAMAVSESDTITLQDLPQDNIRSIVEEVPEKLPLVDKTSFRILKAVRDINDRGEIAGRSNILCEMQEKNVKVSEYRIRKTISLLLKEGLIASAEGRYGLFPTDAGFSLLETGSSEEPK